MFCIVLECSEPLCGIMEFLILDFAGHSNKYQILVNIMNVCVFDQIKQQHHEDQ